jgi:hypothetical protein
MPSRGEKFRSPRFTEEALEEMSRGSRWKREQAFQEGQGGVKPYSLLTFCVKVHIRLVLYCIHRILVNSRYTYKL